MRPASTLVILADKVQTSFHQDHSSSGDCAASGVSGAHPFWYGKIQLKRACAPGMSNVITFATSAAGVHLMCEALPLEQRNLSYRPALSNVKVS